MNDLIWQGYARKHGKPGIRNRVLVLYTVKCAEFVAQQIVLQAAHPDVELVGFDGCTDNQYAVNLLISLIRHPNVGAVLAVGLGCEYVQPEWLARIAEQEGKPAAWMFIQNEGGTEKTVAKGISWVRAALEQLRDPPRTPLRFSDLVIGAECGGSDSTSGLAGNVVVGRLFDRLVDTGGTAIFEEIVEAVGLDRQLLALGLTTRHLVVNNADAELMKAGFMPRLKDITSMLSAELAGVIQTDQNIRISTNLGIPIVLKEGTYIEENFLNIAERITGETFVTYAEEGEEPAEEEALPQEELPQDEKKDPQEEPADPEI